jgi:hypothetical protein
MLVLVPLFMTAQLLLFYVVLRHMKRTMLILAATVLLVATPTADAASRMHKKVLGCRLPAHAHILAANTQALLYETIETEALAGGVIYGCAYGHKGIYPIGKPLPNVGTSEGIGGVKLEVLAGPIVSYKDVSAGPSYDYEAVVVSDLRTGRTLRILRNSERVGAGVGAVVAIVVKADGAVAWIVEAHRELSSPINGYNGAVEYAVEAADESGKRLLASGPGIDPASLALAGSTLYWTQGGKPASSVLN